MTPTVEVSVIIPLYNPGLELRDTLHSVLGGSGPSVEVRLLDDGSSVDPRGLIEDFLEDPRIVFKRSTTNRGAAWTWNALVEATNGRFIKLLPQDDLIATGSLQKQFDALRESSATMVAGRRRLMTRGGRAFGPPFGLSGLLGLRPREAVLEAALREGGNPVGEPGAWLFRRDAGIRTPFRASCGYAIDLAFVLDVLRSGPMLGLEGIHSFFRVSNTAWTAQTAGTQVSDFVAVLQDASGEACGTSSQFAPVVRRARRRAVGRGLVYRLAGGRPPSNGPAVL